MNTLLDLSELNQKIGQLFMAGIPGPRLDEGTEFLIRDFNLGGIILFSRNIEDPVQLARLCRAIQNTAIKYHGNPLFIAIDQEGGRVARLGKPFTLFPGNEAIGTDAKPLEKAKEFGTVTAREMRIVGLNMNLAPVVDVKSGKPEKHLKGRIFGEDHETVALLGRTVVKALQENGVMAVAKHFPGLGCADIDPHLNLPRIDLDIKAINDFNILPFRATIEEGVSAVMTSHALYPSLDPEVPATLSHHVLEGLLRERLGFQGLIITDDLEMGAIAEKWGVSKGALASFNAGADILLICADQKNIMDSLILIREKILREEIPKERLSLSLTRIMKAKSKFIKPKEKILLKNVKRYFRLNA
ncbi:beta-N-acetylhexosaminidase [Deltaproteobacteria bacterium]|nr:beta-N-acetylhexosaminidase [Deltaproteobacteria bacterium]